MSGVEIAGFVLGGFPLLISAAEHYREGFEPLAKWKRFRTDFIRFIDAVDIEKQLFNQLLERFLISADIPQDELQSFMTIPDYDGWHREDLATALEVRLGPSHSAFLGTIQTMHKSMAELHELLLLKDGRIEWASDGASQWDYQLKRIRLSFSKKGSKTLASLETHNRKLAELLDSKDKLDNVKATRRDTTWASMFECIRRHASSLHTAITNSWNCDCTSPHSAALRLQHRKTSEWTSHFSMVFNPPCEGEAEDAQINPPREFMISIKKKHEKEMESPSTVSQLPFTKEIFSDTSTLRRNLASKSSPELTVTSRQSLRTPASSSSASYSTGFSSIFSKRSETTSASSISTLSATSSQSASSIILEETQSRSWLKGRSSPFKKSVRINLPPEIPTHQRGPCAPSPVITESSLKSKDKSHAIKDLCSTLFGPYTEGSCLGHISDDKEQYHEIWPMKSPQPIPRTENSISLQSLLSGENGMRLSRQERYKIASILAASILQLQTTPWLTEKFEKSHIFFYYQGSRILAEHPYIKHSFSSKKSLPAMLEPLNSHPTNRYADRESLSHLGVLLLELCFGQSIESQEIYNSHLGSDGKPHSGTNYMTARDWTEMVYEEDPALENIIRCCVFCIFEEKPDWKSKSFTQAVYTRVVEPLEKLISKWPLS